MEINCSQEIPEDGTFYIAGTITQEMMDENINTDPPHTGARLYIWISGEETEEY